MGSRFSRQLKAKPKYLSLAAHNCSHKIGYKTWAEAERAQKEQRDKHGKEYRIYPCDQCGDYHLTTKEVKP